MKRILNPSTRLIALIMSILLLFGSSPISVAAANTDSGLPKRSGEEIAALWKQLMNPIGDVDNPYQTKPSTSNPYKAGALKTDYIKDAVNALNFHRFIAGLPYDLTSTTELNTLAQHGSVLLASNGVRFSHFPNQPTDMPDAFFHKGEESTSTANIYGSSGYHDHLLVRSINAYMDDSDISNLEVLGHRRWILNPPLKRVGLGLAESANGWSFSALQVFDESRTENVPYNYIAYPAPGEFPIEVFKSNYAWSVSLSSKSYAKPLLKDVTVSLKRLRDHKTWSLNSKNNTVTQTGAYFNVDSSISDTTIIFRPNGVEDYRANDSFEVTIQGLKSLNGASQPLTYTVDFISAENYVPSHPFKDIAKHWASSTITWAVDNKIVSGYTDGTFRPNKTVTEQEFLTMFISAFADHVRPSLNNEPWSARYYDYAIDNGYNLMGIQIQEARAKPLSRLAAAELIVSAVGQSYVGDEAIMYLLDNRYSKGKTAATLEGYAGNDYLTRAEAVQFIKALNDADYKA